MAIEVRVLGPLEAVSGDGAVDLGPPQQRALLALLAVRRPAAVRVTEIEDVLWGAALPPSAGKVVQTYVSRLRRVLGADAIAHGGDGYRLTSAVEVDLERFRAHVTAGRVTDAVALWRGAALADLPALADEARRLEELRLSALEARFGADLDAGAASELVDELQELVAAAPGRERLLGQLMLALYRSGRQTEALEAFRRGRRTLADTLGLEVGPELRDLERRILRHDPSLARPSRSPPPLAVSRRRWPRLVAALVVAGAVAATTVAVASNRTHGPVIIRANSLLEIDPHTDRVVASVPVGRDEVGLESTGDSLWLASERDRTVTRVDVRTHAVKTIGEPHPVAFLAHDDRGNVYASGWDFPFVWQIDPRSVQIVRQFRVETRALGITVGGGSLWVADRLANAVTRIDLAQRRVAQTIPVGQDPLSTAFGFGALWVANSDSGTVSVIRPGASRPLVVNGIPRPYGISAGAGGIWVASNLGDAYRIDPDTHSIVGDIHLGIPADSTYAVKAGLYGVWVIADHHLVRIDPRTDKVIATLTFPRGTSPKAVAFTPSAIWVTVDNPKDEM